MKKVLAILLAMLTLFSVASAEVFTWVTPVVPASWYELSANNEVLTVRLPGNTKTGLTWSFEISNPSALELLTHETIVGESEGMAGAETTYVASFMTMANTANNVSLILRCADEANAAEPAVYTRVLDLATAADNKITINSVLEQEPFADWCEYGDDGYVLTVRMPDAAWSFNLVDSNVIELLTCDDSDGTFVASFMATMETVGETQIVFVSDDEKHYRTVDVFANESGWLEVTQVETFDILADAKLAYCEICGGWFEEGNIFRNHICISPVSSEFKTVNITGNSVNMRAGAGTDYEVITVLKKGANPKYLGQTAEDSKGSDWHMVSADGKTGWVSAGYAKLGGKGYIKVVNGNCNMRKSANLDAEVITVLSKDSVVTYLGEGKTDERGVDWYKVNASGKDGWVSSSYAQFTASASSSSGKSDSSYKYVVIKGGNCNMRKSASINADSVEIMHDGDYGKYLGEKATDDRGVEWYRVSFDGKKGWVSSKYAKLSKTEPAAPSDDPEDTGDMRDYYNPRHYNAICVTDIFKRDGETLIQGCFGNVKKGVPEKFDHRKTFTLALVPGVEPMLPLDYDNYDDLDEVSNPAKWFSKACDYYGSSYQFYASFSMNESGALRSLVFLPVY